VALLILLVAATVFITLSTNRENILIAIDQLINAVFGGYPDETLSARCWRHRYTRKYRILVNIINALFFWQDNHCLESYNSELNRRHLPYSYRNH
jgi:hypothetical protein